MGRQESEDRLFTPSNIKVRYEFISGFGFNELFTAVIVSSVVGAIVFFINLFMQKMDIYFCTLKYNHYQGTYFQKKRIR